MSEHMPTTIQELLDFLSPVLARSTTPPPWPPDVFGLMAALLQESGAYLFPFAEWPPADVSGAPTTWAERMQVIGRQWRQGWPKEPPPAEIAVWWTLLQTNASLPLPEIPKNREVCCALLQLCAAADEASADVGAQRKKLEEDRFGAEAETQLVPSRKTGSTLCRDIHPTKLLVLPKFHTPQTGMTLRSLSHHLALWRGPDVKPLWFTASPPSSHTPLSGDSHCMSLLLIPWPKTVTPRQFTPAKPARGALLNMPDGEFGFFNYQHEPDPSRALTELKTIYHAANKLTERIDGVILPELALAESEFSLIRRWVTETEQKSFLIAGVGTPGEDGRPGRNQVRIEVPFKLPQPAGSKEDPDPGEEWARFSAFQDKHHRWRLDRNQIVQYGLGGQLDPSRRWWEHTEAAERSLVFIALRPWLSLCALVCEDLARQDPVANLVRAVGPNLVVSLLMDGPQLTSRWPARYATILADDPGSSVLSLTSIGMCEFSRPPGKPPSRTIALWKDAFSGEAIQINLPAGADAILLNVVRHKSEEWSADGRSDGGVAGYPTLAGIHPVFRSGES
jgi:hypothetical protein